MPELDLPACPICFAKNSLSLRVAERAGERFAWYTCRECGSDLLSIGHGRWVYQKIGRKDRLHLLKRPLKAAELQQLLSTAAPAAMPATLQEWSVAIAALARRVQELSPVIVGSAIAVGIFVACAVLMLIVSSIGPAPDPAAAGVATEASLLPPASATPTATATATPAPPPTATRISAPRPTLTPSPPGSPIVIGHWQIQVRQVLVADSISSAYGDGVERAAGRFVLLFMTVSNQGRSPDTFGAFATLEILDAEGRRYAANSVATHYAQSTHRTSLAVDVPPGKGVYIVVVYDISRKSASYTLVPGALAGKQSGSVRLDIP